MYEPGSEGNAIGACDGTVADVPRSAVVWPVLLSNRAQRTTYPPAGAGATPALTAALSNVSNPLSLSARFTTGLIAVRYVRPIASRRWISTPARRASAAGSLYRPIFASA